jgi:two-component system chemotaxis sensor kinase CheA
MSDEQMIRMIFRSGFSTKTEVTDISGRGVGLDVVMEHVRQLRGSVDIETSAGEGTTFMIQLPLTLAILQVLLARVGERLYALPLHTVRETLQIEHSAIQRMQQGQVLSLREEVLPVHALKDLLHVEVTGSEANHGSPNAQLPPEQAMEHAVVVHLASGNEIWIVDELMGKQQVVVQTLPSYLGTVRGVEGAAILPDGSVTLILDLEGLAWE